MIEQTIKFHLMLGFLILPDIIKGILESQISILICSTLLFTLQIVQLILIVKCKKYEDSTCFILFSYNVIQLLHYGTQSIWLTFCLLQIYKTNKVQLQKYSKAVLVTLSIILFSFSYQGNIVYSEFQSIIQCVAFLLYELKQVDGQISIIEMAENEILQELKKQMIVKIFDSNYRDITPKNKIQLEINSYVQITQNTQLDEHLQFYIKCYQDQDFTSSPDQNSNKSQQLVFQDCYSLLEFINGQELIQSNDYNHYIASSVDTQKNIKQKFVVMHKSINQGNLQILSFLKIDNFMIKQTKKKFHQFKKSFTDLFAHKLKTPLNATLGFLSSAYNSIDVDNQTKSNFIKPAYINSKLQYFQISDLLEFLSTQTDKIIFQSSKIYMRQFLQQLSELIESQCINKRILFQVFVDQIPLQKIENFYIISDVIKLERVLYNILNFSYRHTPSGGQINLNINFNQERTEIYFSIDGSGDGFSDEDIENINLWIKQQCDFQFKKQHLVIKKELKMSLKITNNLINILSSQEQHLEVAQSELGVEFRFKLNIKESKTVESQQDIQSVGVMLRQRSLKNMKSSQNNCGTNKSIFSSKDTNIQLYTLNVIDEPQANQPLTNKIHNNKWQRKNKNQKSLCSSLINKGLIDTDKLILIVDDEPFNHDTLILLMKSMGYKNFLKAFNGQQAVEMAQENQQNILLILMDLDMPIMGGIEATKILVQMMIDLEMTYVPIIGCTAHDDRETLDLCIEVGMLHVVQKPVFVRTLREAFQHIIHNEDFKKKSQYFQTSQLQI